MQANIGERFGRLVVIEDCTRPGERPRRLCRCDCGTEKEVMARHLLSGKIASCRCLQRETVRRVMTTHGRTRTAEYRTWKAIQARCSNPHLRSFADYGGRGIQVCERWRNSFENFHADMGARPSPAHSIDRIDNDGPYSPENCRWATAEEQARNTRRSRLITFRGETLCMLDWARRFGIDSSALRARLEHGWDIQTALTTPSAAAPPRTLTHDGETRTIAEWARRIGLSPEALDGRLRTGWSTERALTEPVRQRL